LVEGKYPKLKLHVLDCGLALEMGPEQHVNIVKVLGAFTRRDGTLAGQLMVDMKSESQANEEQRKLFIEGIEQICIMDEDQNFIECVGDYIADICSMACKNRVKLEAAFVNAALAVEIMEGLASALHPDLKVQHIALPLIVKAEMMVSCGKLRACRRVSCRGLISSRFSLLCSIAWAGTKHCNAKFKILLVH
jgi:aarF domain-containing kinase